MLVTNLAPCVGLRMHLWPEKGQQGENGLDNEGIEVTMRMVQLPSGPTHPQVLVSSHFFQETGCAKAPLDQACSTWSITV